DEMKGYLKQKPNKKIFGVVRFHLGLYNLSKVGSSGGISGWLHKIGEEPIIFDEYVTNNTTQQLTKYLETKGYYNAIVRDSVKLEKRKAEVYYIVELNQPRIIRNLSYQYDKDTLNEDLWSLILADTSTFQVKAGKIEDREIFENDRERITAIAKNNGYYKFSKDYVQYIVYYSLSNNLVDVSVIIGNVQGDTINGGKHLLYHVREISFETNYDPKTVLMDENTIINADTIVQEEIKFIYNDKLNIKPNVLIETNYIKKGKLYNYYDVEQTSKNLGSLGVFKGNPGIYFQEIPDSSGTSLGSTDLECIIQLTPHKSQELVYALDGTHSNGNLGIAGNLSYKHRNLFRGAESFDLKFIGAVEMINDNDNNLDKIIKYGLEATINSPKFFLPFRMDNFFKRFHPKTSLNFVYNFQKRPDYTRLITNLNFGYLWNSTAYISHIVNPIEFNFVNVTDISSNFSDIIKGTYIENSFKTHLVSVSRYSIEFNNFQTNKNADHSFFRINLESGGNLITGFNKIINSKKTENSYQLFGTRYAQFVKTDIELRRYKWLNESSSIVGRVFIGAGLPYGNMNVMPFEKKYYSGGANGIRAWQARSLGPGSYVMDESESKGFYPNQLGDIKIELNLEYRFDLFWKLEGAVFLDAGNIWAINNSDDREGSLFKLNSFYKEIAVGTGLGARVDFRFFLLRLDVGYKLRDPAYPLSNRWVPGNGKFQWN
ncbi:BamA/TamA family outer membrane protein, partial [Bacteroidota bacterium]